VQDRENLEKTNERQVRSIHELMYQLRSLEENAKQQPHLEEERAKQRDMEHMGDIHALRDEIDVLQRKLWDVGQAATLRHERSQEEIEAMGRKWQQSTTLLYEREAALSAATLEVGKLTRALDQYDRGDANKEEFRKGLEAELTALKDSEGKLSALLENARAAYKSVLTAREESQDRSAADRTRLVALQNQAAKRIEGVVEENRQLKSELENVSGNRDEAWNLIEELRRENTALQKGGKFARDLTIGDSFCKMITAEDARTNADGLDRSAIVHDTRVHYTVLGVDLSDWSIPSRGTLFPGDILRTSRRGFPQTIPPMVFANLPRAETTGHPFMTRPTKPEENKFNLNREVVPALFRRLGMIADARPDCVKDAQTEFLRDMPTTEARLVIRFRNEDISILEGKAGHEHQLFTYAAQLTAFDMAEHQVFRDQNIGKLKAFAITRDIIRHAVMIGLAGDYLNISKVTIQMEIKALENPWTEYKATHGGPAYVFQPTDVKDVTAGGPSNTRTPPREWVPDSRFYRDGDAWIVVAGEMGCPICGAQGRTENFLSAHINAVHHSTAGKPGAIFIYNKKWPTKLDWGNA
jgi:hypothetical protein